MGEQQREMVDVLQSGLQDEMNAAFQYIALAGKYGDSKIKEAFLRYASEELTHARKLLELLQQRNVPVEQIPVTLDEMDDLYLYLIEYMAREESAIFYYETLEKLVQDPALQNMCREIRGEEQLHLHKMRELYQQIRECSRHE